MIKRIPKRFYDDCSECGASVPPIVRATKKHYYVDTSKGDPEMLAGDFDGRVNETDSPMDAAETMADFISRAKYYSDEFGFDRGCAGLCKSASATLRALEIDTPAKIKKQVFNGTEYVVVGE